MGFDSARWTTELFLRERDRGILAAKPFDERDPEEMKRSLNKDKSPEEEEENAKLEEHMRQRKLRREAKQAQREAERAAEKAARKEKRQAQQSAAAGGAGAREEPRIVEVAGGGDPDDGFDA